LNKQQSLGNLFDGDTKEKSGNGSFTFLQILILLQDMDILKYIVHNHKDWLKDETVRTVSIASKLEEVVISKDRWIFQASSLHLAAKFFPHGLKLLLSNFENNQTLMELVSKKNQDGSTPLHLAAQNLDSLSTR
jgi:hypothetical protein